MGILNYSDEEVRNWMQGKSADQIAQQAASMGLNQSQISEGLRIGGVGGGTDAERAATISSYTAAPTSNYAFGSGGGLTTKTSPTTNVPRMNGTAVGAGNFYGYDGKSNSLAAPSGDSFVGSNGQTYTGQQVRDWYKQNPNFGSDLEMMAKLGLKAPDLYKARALAGQGDGTGIYTDPKEMEPYGQYLKGQQTAQGLKPGALSFFDWRAQQDPNYLASLQNGQNGNIGWTGGPAGGVPVGYSGGGANGGGSPNSPGGGSGGGSAGGSGGAGGTNGGSSSSAGGTSGPGNWQVTPDQTVESRVAGILAAGNPLVTQRRAQSDMKMNARGLVSSSIAQTASDDAAYSAALDIARPDAATFADAAKTNAMAKTTWGISQANNQTSRDNTQAQIGAQRELQRATQLYNNLTSQTTTATNLQQWGLNTVASIQASDLSAEAKSTAIQTIQQYLQDSFQIQGDWHTSAARMIDSIFD